MKHLIKLYDTWEKVRNIFVKPSLKVYFGRWRNDPNLPVWRRGAHIYLIGRKYRGFDNSKVHILRDRVMIYTGEAPFTFGDKTYTTKCYDWAHKHKLPGKLKVGQYVWNRKIRKRLKKWHLSWISPIIELPLWTRFHIVNLGLGWKTKYDDVRYEFPPQFSIIAFGFSLTFTLHSPVWNNFCNDSSYWEAILVHLYENKSGTIKETIKRGGVWRKTSDGKSCYYFSVRPEFFMPRYLKEYYAACSELRFKDDRIVL